MRWSRTGLSCTEPEASRPFGFDPSCDHGSLAGGTRLRVPPSFHSGVAITALRSGAFLTGLATALGPESRRYGVGAMLTLLRVLLFLVHGERFALALMFVSLSGSALSRT